MTNHLLAGVAGVDITPLAGVDLTGFGGRSGPSTSVHDDLAARVLYLNDGNGQAMVVSLDLIGLGREESLALRTRIAATVGVSAAAVLIGCSHTHSGPATHCLRFLGGPDEEYLSGLSDAVVECAQRAAASPVHVCVGWGRAAAGIGVNRRRHGGDEPGPVDSGIAVLRLVTATGVPMAHVFCHAAHAVTLGSDNLAVSADWPGYARRVIEAETGGLALFLQGCCGNINCRERNTFAAAENQGRRVAEAVLGAVGSMADRDARLGVAHRLVDVPLQSAPPPERCARIIADERAAQSRLPCTANRGQQWMAEAGVAWAEVLSRLPDTPRTMPYEIQVLRVGDGALVALPGEVFVEYAHRIAAASPFPVTAVASYASDCPSYIPTAAAYAEGGYEVDNAIRYYGTTMPVPESESLIVGTATELLQRVADGHR
jgi:hypothetical protein